MDLYEARRLALLRILEREFQGKQSVLADRAGIARSYLARMLKEAGHKDCKRMGEDMAMKLEDRLGLVSGTLLTPIDDEVSPDQQVDHSVSERAWRMYQIGTPTWEQLLMMKSRDELATHFQVAAPDNSMAPRLRLGVKATFERDLTPQFGDAVLVRDGSGELHIRVYRRGRPGTWEAHALNDDFAPLVSDRDGLEVWAVLTAVEGRWS